MTSPARHAAAVSMYAGRRMHARTLVAVAVAGALVVELAACEKSPPRADAGSVAPSGTSAATSALEPDTAETDAAASIVDASSAPRPIVRVDLEGSIPDGAGQRVPSNFRLYVRAIPSWVEGTELTRAGMHAVRTKFAGNANWEQATTANAIFVVHRARSHVLSAAEVGESEWKKPARVSDGGASYSLVFYEASADGKLELRGPGFAPRKD